MGAAVCARHKRHLDPVETSFFGSASRLSRRLRSSLSLGSHHRRPSPWSEILSQVASVEWATGGALRGSSQLTGRRGAETLGHWEDGNGRRIGPIAPTHASDSLSITVLPGLPALPCLSRRRLSDRLRCISRKSWSWRFPALPSEIHRRAIFA